MRDFAIRQGELVDLRAMYLDNQGDWEETWIWKPAQGAQALTLGPRGFVTSRGDVYRTLNSAAAFDPALTPKPAGRGPSAPRTARSAMPPGVRCRRGPRARPAYRYAEDPAGGGLSAAAERTRRGWRVVFTRALEAGPGRQAFRPGESYHFGVAIFDATSVNHHIVRDTKTLQLVAPPQVACRRSRRDPDGAGAAGGTLP